MGHRPEETQLHERLREARALAGLSQGQVAKKLGMHRPTISEIEAGRRKVSAAEIRSFSELYGVANEWLLTGRTSSSSYDQKVKAAAREFSRMSEEDIDRLLKIIGQMREDGDRL